jgi:hypothetical protein
MWPAPFGFLSRIAPSAIEMAIRQFQQQICMFTRRRLFFQLRTSMALDPSLLRWPEVGAVDIEVDTVLTSLSLLC